jgi:hypothetical protein
MAQAGEDDAGKLLEEMRKTFATEPRVQLDYAAIVNPTTLEPVAQVNPGSVALVAARFGRVRLIDNLIFGPPGLTPEQKLQLALTTQAADKESSATLRPEIESLRPKTESCRKR